MYIIYMDTLYNVITNKRMNSTTGQQLLKKVKTNVIDYRNLYKYKTLDNIFKNGQCILFIPNNYSNIGHWVCIFKRDKNTVEFFNSYGRPPMYYEERNNDGTHYLTQLICNSKYNVYYNPYEFQSEESSACGRHVISRLLLKKYPIKIYKELMTSPYEPDFADDFVSFYTMNI